MSLSSDTILTEAAEDFGEAHVLAAKFDQVFERSLWTDNVRLASSERTARASTVAAWLWRGRPRWALASALAVILLSVASFYLLRVHGSSMDQIARQPSPSFPPSTESQMASGQTPETNQLSLKGLSTNGPPPQITPLRPGNNDFLPPLLAEINSNVQLNAKKALDSLKRGASGTAAVGSIQTSGELGSLIANLPTAEQISQMEKVTCYNVSRIQSPPPRGPISQGPNNQCPKDFEDLWASISRLRQNLVSVELLLAQRNIVAATKAANDIDSSTQRIAADTAIILSRYTIPAR